LVEVYNTIEVGMMEMQVTPDTYVTWKKDLIKKLKEFDKMYGTHVKTTHVELNTMHTTAMQPLTNLLESNLNFHYLEVIAKKKDVPNFRIQALEDKFEGHLTRVCEIFRDYGVEPCRLKEFFNIRQMLISLKTENWA
jgi:hypothetical protein